MMYDYDKDAFIAGYRAAFALRGWGTPGLRHIRQLRLLEPYTVEWHGENSVTVSWTVQSGEVQGLIVEPGLFPVTISGSVDGEQQGSFQWGVCTLDGFLPTVITAGAEREWYVNGIPDSTVITDSDPTNMGSVFCGDIYATPGAKMTLTVSWGGVSLARIITEAGEPLITEAMPMDVTNFVGGEWYMYSRYSSYAPDAAIVDTGFAARLERDMGHTPNYFMWHDTGNLNMMWQVWWTHDPGYLNSSTFSLYRLGEQYAIERTGTSWYTAKKAGDIWYYAHASFYRPDNAEVITGTLEELEDYLAGIAGRYLITN